MKIQSIKLQGKRSFSCFLALALIITACLSASAVYSSAAASDTETYINTPGDLWDGESSDTEFAGSGTQADPYQITTAAELYGFVRTYCGETAEDKRHEDNLYAVLKSDIYLNDVRESDWATNSPNEWYSINKWTRGGEGMGFRGHFDGNGHTVYGLYFAPDKYDDAGDSGIKAVSGLMPLASGSAVISNVNVRYSAVKAFGGACQVGSIIGFVQKDHGGDASHVTVEKCVADQTVDFSGLTNAHAGGIVGCVGGPSHLTVRYCGSSVKFNTGGQRPAGKGGGIVGNSDWGAESIKITNSYSVSSFISGTPSAEFGADISDGTLYSAYSGWETWGNVKQTLVQSASMIGKQAKESMPNLGWDIWETNFRGYPIIKGSTSSNGDANCDGIVDILDLVRVKKYAAGILTKICLAADLNGDLNINAEDCSLLRKNLLEQ